MNPNRITVAIGLAVSCLVAGGCTVIDRKFGDSLPVVEEAGFELGVVRVGDVLEDFGPPAKISALPGGFVFLYEHLEFVEDQIGISIPVEFLEWFKFF